MPDWINGFVKNKSVKTNAEAHLNKRMIIAFDIKDFFESTNEGILKKALNKYFDKDVTKLLIDVCLLGEGLPQGAPTSPVLANISFIDIDIRLKELSDKNYGTYTRYADDITISSSDRGIYDLIRYIENIVEDGGYTIKSTKTRSLPTSGRQVVTGLVVNKKVQPSINYRQNLKAKLHNIMKEMKKNGHKIEVGLMAQLKGECSWVRAFNPGFVDKYLQSNLDYIFSNQS
jgi:retron-type reverse transcriptase